MLSWKKINRALERAGKMHSHSTYMVSWIKMVMIIKMICKKWRQKPADFTRHLLYLLIHSSTHPLTHPPFTYPSINPHPYPLQPNSGRSTSELLEVQAWRTQVPALKELTESFLKSAHGSFFPIIHCKCGRSFALLLLSWDQQHLCQRAYWEMKCPKGQPLCWKFS